MTFMNKKEEVLDIKLTQYGKKLLSEGKFDPSYYSFHDEGILYDSSYASYQEDQNKTEERISKNTPTLKTQHNFTSAKNSGGILRIEQSDGSVKEIDLFQISQRDCLGLSLGTSEYNNENMPSINLKMFDGEITSIDQAHTGSLGNKIPQIDCKIEANAQIRNISDVDKYDDGFAFNVIDSPVDSDGFYLTVKSPNFVLELIESNTDFESENFEIEVFYDPDGENIPLSFANKSKQKQVINGILINDTPEEDDDFIAPEKENVEYYFNIATDDDIPPAVLSAAVAHFKSKGFYNDTETFSTKKKATLEISDIYSSTTDPDDIEDCR